MWYFYIKESRSKLGINSGRLFITYANGHTDERDACCEENSDACNENKAIVVYKISKITHRL